MTRTETNRLVLTAILASLIIVMTFIPFTGYITVGVVEITTLHIPVILGAVFLGWKCGALLGATWGIMCMLRAFLNPLWVLFTNPLISLFPRIIVGIVAGAVFYGLHKINKVQNSDALKMVSAAIAAIAATLTNTILVLLSIYFFGDSMKSAAALYDQIITAFNVIISANGLIELGAALIIIPVLYKSLAKSYEYKKL